MSTSEDPSQSTAIGPKPVGGQVVVARQGAIKLKRDVSMRKLAQAYGSTSMYVRKKNWCHRRG